MGNTQQNKTAKKSEISRSSFNFHYVIGRGGYGRVWRVEYKRTRQIFAMKQMLKLRVISKRSIYSVLNQRKLLSLLKHPFIVNMQCAFQDKQKLYLAMDLMTGGDLRYHISQKRSFSQQETRFFIACVVTGLEYLHVNNILHRDIKPQNLVLDQKGYLRITDFGIASENGGNNYKDTSGTPGYMAPEVICRQNHGMAADYFALGVIAFEFMTGRRPYTGRNRKEIRDNILSKQVQLRRSDVPQGWSIESVDFINKLLQRKATNRLGFKGPLEVKNHAWLRDFPWKKLLEKRLDAPFKPAPDDNFDPVVVNNWNEDIEGTISQPSVQELFAGYYYFNPEDRKRKNESETSRLRSASNRVLAGNRLDKAFSSFAYKSKRSIQLNQSNKEKKCIKLNPKIDDRNLLKVRSIYEQNINPALFKFFGQKKKGNFLQQSGFISLKKLKQYPIRRTLQGFTERKAKDENLLIRGEHLLFNNDC